MKRKFQEINPSNARICINYLDKENPVTFDYPAKQTAFDICFAAFLSIWTKIILVFMIANILPLAYVLIFGYEKNKIIVGEILKFTNSIPITYSLSFVGIIILAVPFIMTVIFVGNKTLLKKMPEINKFLSLLSSLSYRETVVRKLDNKIFEILMFDNVFLDYKAKGDFSKYLEKVDIIEHPFHYRKVSIFSKKIRKIRQDEYWKARFIFNKIPKKGYLKITYL